VRTVKTGGYNSVYMWGVLKMGAHNPKVYESIRQVGVYLLLTFKSSRLRCHPQYLVVLGHPVPSYNKGGDNN
jgi:hypothetical protein